jgi:hypothetical protein
VPKTPLQNGDTLQGQGTQRRGTGQISKGMSLFSYILIFCSVQSAPHPRASRRSKIEGQSFYRCVSAGHGSAEAERFVLLIGRLEAFSVVIQDPPYLFATPPPSPASELKPSCIRDHNPDLVFFHFPSYLTCPFACRTAIAQHARLALSNLIALLRWNSPCE